MLKIYVNSKYEEKYVELVGLEEILMKYSLKMWTGLFLCQDRVRGELVKAREDGCLRRCNTITLKIEATSTSETPLNFHQAAGVTTQRTAAVKR
jgi:hypothetical protein